MTRSCRILHLEDAPLDSELLAETLKAEYLPCEVTWVDGRQAFESALAASWNYDLILADYRVPGLDGEEALALAQARCPGLPFIFLSGHLDEAQVVKLLRQGAKDCVFKHHLARLGPVVRRALQEAREAEARRAAEAANTRLAALLRATLEATSEGVLVVDLAGRIATFNRKFLALCGLPDYLMAPMELEPVLRFLLDQAEDPEALLAGVMARPAGEESISLIKLKDARILEARSSPQKVSGETVGRIYSFRNLTGLVEARIRGAFQGGP